MKKIIVALLASAVSVSAANAGEEKANATDIDTQVEARFADVDANKDGIVTREEFDANYTAKAEQAASEGKAWDEAHKEKASADFVAMAGEDGSVTLDEAKAYVIAKQEAAAAKEASQGS